MPEAIASARYLSSESSAGVAVVGRLRTAEGDDKVDFLEGRRIEVLEIGGTFENIERPELEAAFEQSRSIVFGQGFGFGVAYYQCEFSHMDNSLSYGETDSGAGRVGRVISVTRRRCRLSLLGDPVPVLAGLA